MKKAFAIAMGLALAAGAVSAQTTWKVSCTNLGPGAPEPLGEGHFLSVVTATCLVQGGPLDGGVVTQSVIWENVQGTLTLLSGDGVVRKPGTTVAYRNTSGTLKTIMKDGKPAGWEGSGASLYTMGTGAGAVMKGKTVTWTAKATGPRTYVVDNRMD